MSPLIATVVGARPQFIKCALLGPELRRAGLSERLIHTGQHYDPALSEVFFRELEIPAPDVNLGIGSDSPVRQVARMMLALGEDFERQRPDLVLVFGDTNTTLAGALAALKAGLPLAHVEAGMRSRNMAMPEEHNRVLTDHAASLLFCHSDRAARLLAAERVQGRVIVSGDVMRETVERFLPRALETSPFPKCLDLAAGGYAILTVHRAGNTEGPGPLLEILRGMDLIGLPVVFPIHPRTRHRCLGGGADLQFKNIRITQPLGYLDMLALTHHARLIVTDSGGLQKEAFFIGTPCVTLRGETEWTETIELGVNKLAGDRPSAEALAAIAGPAAWRQARLGRDEAAIAAYFGPPGAPARIAEALAQHLI